MADMQSETAREEEKWQNRLKEALEKAMRAIENHPIVPLKEKLMKALVKKLDTDPDHVKAMAVADENVAAMEAWLQKNNIPYFPLPGRSRETVLLLGDDQYQKAFDYSHAVERLDADYTAWSPYGQFAEDAKEVGDNSIVTFSLDKSEGGDELFDEVVDKIHEDGAGFAVGRGDLATGKDKNGDLLFSSFLSVRLNGACDADKDTPDMFSVLTETAVDQVNGLKTIVKKAAHEIDDKNLDKFITNVERKTSCDLTDAFSPSAGGSLSYDRDMDCIYYIQPDTSFKRILMDKDDLENLRQNPVWQTKIKSQLSHYTASLNNMTCLLPMDMKELSHKSKEDLLAEEEEANDSVIYKKLFSIAEKAENGEDVDFEKEFSPDSFTVRPTFNAKKLYDRIKKDKDAGKHIPKAMEDMITLDIYKEGLKNDITSFVHSKEIELKDYGPEARVEYFRDELMRSMKDETGCFSGTLSHMKENMPEAINAVKGTFDILFSHITVDSVTKALSDVERSKALVAEKQGTTEKTASAEKETPDIDRDDE